jgi:hypothetical protein
VTVTDATYLLKQVVVSVSYPGEAAPEVVYDGTAFAPAYSKSTLNTSLNPSTYLFSVVRTGGWIGNPTVNVYAIDASGGFVPSPSP